MSEQGARKGFTGKQIIHPGQVSIVEAAFTPSSDRIEWATELIQGFNEHQAQGKVQWLPILFKTFVYDYIGVQLLSKPICHAKILVIPDFP